MTNKTLLWIAALAFSAVAVAGPKSYGLTLSAPMKAGSAQLASGEYKVSVDGSNAIFTDQQTRKSLTVPVKVENNTKKYPSTILNTTNQGEMPRITAIELGGSKMKLEFGQ